MRFFHVIYICVFLASLSACAAGEASADAQVSPQPQTYLENKGSDTIVNLALAWAEKYQEIHPEVRISVTGGGSGTGITALINNTVDISNASRKIKSEEIKEARKKGSSRWSSPSRVTPLR